MKRVVLPIAGFAVVCATLHLRAYAAERIDGHQLLNQCQKLGEGAASNYYAGTCAGYIMGVIDSHNGAAGTDKMPESYFCLAGEASRGQLIDIVLKYVEKHPEQRDFGGATLIWMALVYEYPCGDWHNSGTYTTAQREQPQASRD